MASTHLMVGAVLYANEETILLTDRTDIRTTTMYAHLATPQRLADLARLLGKEDTP